MNISNGVYKAIRMNWDAFTFPIAEGTPVSAGGVEANDSGAFGLIPQNVLERPLIPEQYILVSGAVSDLKYDLSAEALSALSDIHFIDLPNASGGGGSGGGSGSGGDVGMLIMPYDRMARIREYVGNKDVEEVLANIQAHPTGWDEECTPSYYSMYWPGDPDYDGATADDYEETFTLHFGNISGTSTEPTFDVTLNLYGVHYKLSCGFEVDSETGDPRLVTYVDSEVTEPLYDADVVTAIPRISDTVMRGCYYAELIGSSATTADVEFYRLDGTPLYVYSTLSWETQGESGYFCHVGEIMPNPDEATISESELAYLTFKFYALFQKGNMSMGSSLQSAFYAAMERLFDLPDYEGPTPVFIF